MQIDPILLVDIDAEWLTKLSANIIWYVYFATIGALVVLLLIMVCLTHYNRQSAVLKIFHYISIYTTRGPLSEVIVGQHGNSALERTGVSSIMILGKSIRPETQLRMYGYYMLFLPLQFSILAFIIMESIFTESYSSETCQTYNETIVQNDISRHAYYCRLNPELHASSTIDTYCNSSTNGTSFLHIPDEIICIHYYRESSKWIYIVTSFLVWQRLLSVTSFYLIFAYIWVYNKLFRKRVLREGSCCRFLYGFLYMILMAIIPFFMMTIGRILYIVVGDTRTKSLLLVALSDSAINVVYVTLLFLSISIHTSSSTEELFPSAYPIVLLHEKNDNDTNLPSRPHQPESFTATSPILNS